MSTVLKVQDEGERSDDEGVERLAQGMNGIET